MRTAICLGNIQKAIEICFTGFELLLLAGNLHTKDWTNLFEISGSVLWVERLYCERPILCLASSKILTPPPPLTARRVCTPRLWRAGGEDTRWVERGVGGQYFGRRQTQLCTLHMYFVSGSFHEDQDSCKKLLDPKHRQAVLYIRIRSNPKLLKQFDYEKSFVVRHSYTVRWLTV